VRIKRCALGLSVMTYEILKLFHLIGAVLIGAGLIGVWLSDMRSRQVRDLSRFSEAVRNIAVLRRHCYPRCIDSSDLGHVAGY
jgi:hypothetical protein